MSTIGNYLEDKVNNLIQEHKTMKQECFELLQELNSLNDSKMSVEEKEALKESKIKLSEEYECRVSFISDLENLL